MKSKTLKISESKEEIKKELEELVLAAKRKTTQKSRRKQRMLKELRMLQKSFKSSRKSLEATTKVLCA